MANIYKDITNIQSRYFELLEQHFTAERQALQPITPDLDDRAFKVAQQSPVIRFEGRDMPSTTYKAITLVREIHSFWDQNGETLYDLIKQIPNQTLYAKSSFQTLLDEVKNAALYVDTIVADDWIYGSREMVEDGSRSHQGELGITILCEYMHLMELRELVTAQVIPPILIICPSPHYAKKEIREVSTNIARWLGLEYANRLFDRQFTTLPEIVEYGAAIRNEPQLIKKIADPSLIWEEGKTLENKVERKLQIAGYSLNASGFPSELAEKSPATTLIVHVLAGFDVIAQQYVDNELLDVDIKVSPYHWEEYLWSLGFQSIGGRVVHIGKAKEETAIAHILDLPDMAWLGNVPVEHLISIREQGKMEEFRSLFRDARERLKYVNPEDVPRLAKEIRDTLESSLKEHAKYLKSNKRNELLGWATDIGGFIVAGGLAAATPAIPLLAIPAAIIGLGAGVGSVRDIVRRFQRSRGQKQIEENRPIGVLWKARSEGGGVSR